ncbi:MAG: S8 family serine peptidase [Bacteroidota bacterium]
MIPLRITLLLMLPGILSAQKLNKYWIELTDKDNSPFSVNRPAEFLSLQAIERRENARIAVDESDLPVNPPYVKAIEAVGARIHGTSRWLNAVSVIADSATATSLQKLPFVKKVQYLGPHLKIRNQLNQPAKKRGPGQEYPRPGGDENPWGYATLQNSLLGVPVLHAAGFRGSSIRIAVMDGGFTGVDTLPFFDSLALHGRLVVGRDFVELDTSLFESAQHGTSVLSVMAACLPGYFTGTAPEATYYLLKTEDTGGEFPIEEANWVAGAEWADSAGVHIINASLGYTAFNDPRLGHFYAELDGKTAIGSKGAAMAASKGIIVCNSAGNEGDGAWRHTGVPADARGIIAVGAMDDSGNRASFSSLGPTADGRIKPDLIAPGDMVVVAGEKGIDLGLSSGTSLASPMLAGSIAALWSAFPEKTAREITDAVFAASDQVLQPDNERGYGLPDMTRAWLRLGGFTEQDMPCAFDRTSGKLAVLLNFQPTGELKVELRSQTDQVVRDYSVSCNSEQLPTLTLGNLSRLPTGLYHLILSNGSEQIRCSFAATP